MSVNQKTNFKFVCIIADDCSNDNTIKIVAKYISNFPNLIILFACFQRLIPSLQVIYSNSLSLKANFSKEFNKIE